MPSAQLKLRIAKSTAQLAYLRPKLRPQIPSSIHRYNGQYHTLPKGKLSSSEAALPVPAELIQRRIYIIRGRKVMLDADLAELYRVTTGNLNLAVSRNANRFPGDFMFQLSRDEFDSLRLQIARSKAGRGGRRTLPYAFTEHGVAMLSAVLKSERAVEMSILIVRAFVRMRELLAHHKELASRVEKLEAGHRRHASVINILAEEIGDLKIPKPLPPKRRIGFPAPKG